jgi:hypothetical protein
VGVLGVIAGCAQLKALHSTTKAEASPDRVGAAWLYPDSQTPGATDPLVTQANIQTTICKDGWAKKVGPPVNYTSALKRRQLAARGDTVADPDQKCMPHSANPQCYEEDHLISLELGGAPRDPKNLWPQPYKTAPGAKEKDWVENYLHEQVCAGDMTLLGAQHVLVTDWFALYVAKHNAPKSEPVAASTGSPTAGASKQAEPGVAGGDLIPSQGIRVQLDHDSSQ